jgi:hypothetical protein
MTTSYDNVEELLRLFGIKDTVLRITEEHISIAKRVSQKLHPDKSKLSSEHFTFYRDACLTLIKLYEHQERYDDNEVESKYVRRMANYNNDKTIHDLTKGNSNNFSNGSEFDLKSFNDSFASASFVNKKDNSWFGQDRIIDDKNATLVVPMYKIDEFSTNCKKVNATSILDKNKFEAYQKSYNKEKEVKCTTIAAYNSFDHVSYNSIESVYRDNIFLCGSTMFSDDVTIEEQAKLQEFDAKSLN